jgi:3-oxoacyl-[acyl-carrier protein] reductase
MTTPVTATIPTQLRLAGRRVVVTGGARGIGESIARRFAAEGATVVVLDRLEREGTELADQIDGHFVAVDLSDPASIVEAMDAAITRLGSVDVLVNNAGILKKAALLDITVEEWDTVFDINARAMLVTTQIAARAMRDAGTTGKIVNLASMAAKTGGAGQAHYAASKSAVMALTRVSALELGPLGITANCICPGYVLTEMGAPGRTDADVALWSTYSPLGRLGETSDVAAVAAFLASADADYLTGLAVDVSGGMTTC